MVYSAHVSGVGRSHDGSDWGSHHGHVEVLRVGSPAGSFNWRHTDEGKHFPAEDNGDGPEDEEVEKYPRIGKDVERILQEVRDIHGLF